MQTTELITGILGILGFLSSLLFIAVGARAISRRHAQYRGAEFRGRSAVAVGILFVTMGLCSALAGVNLLLEELAR